MKKIIVSLLSIVMLFSLVGCGEAKETASNNQQEQKKDEIVKLGEAKDNGSWNIKINKAEELKEIKGHDLKIQQ